MSADARFSPLAPVGGTICAASPARNSRPYCIGAATKARTGVTPFWKMRPSLSSALSSSPRRMCSSSHMPLIRPQVQVFVRLALNVESRNLRRTAARQCIAAIMVGIGHFLERRRLRQDAEPAERKNTVIGFEDAVGNGRATDTVEAVATRDKVAFQRLVLALVGKANAWLVGIDIVDGYGVRFEQQRAAGLHPRRDEILHHLRLAVDGGDLAAAQRLHVHVNDLTQETDIEGRIDHAFAMQPLAAADFVHQIDGMLLEHAGADTTFDILAAARFQNHAIDAGPLQADAPGIALRDPLR